MSLTSTLRRLLVLALLALLLLGTGATWLTMRHPDAMAPPVYVALGASDTVGAGADQPSTEGWTPRIHAALPPATQFLNLGIGGATLGDVLEEQLPPAVDAAPRWVSVWPGVNDLRRGVALDSFGAQLEVLLRAFQPPGRTGENVRPTVLVLNIPDLRHLPAFRSADANALDATVREWNAVIAAVANRHGAILVDLYGHGLELSEHPEYISADGFHPSSEGYRRIAELALEALDHHASSPVP